MIRTFVAALATVLLAAGAAEAKDRVCTGKAEVDKGPSVSVAFTLDAAGAVKSRRATWSPDSGTIEVSGAMIGVPVLEVEYDQPTEAGVGAPARMIALFMIFTENARALDKTSLVYELPDGRAWREAAFVSKGEGDVGGLGLVGVSATFQPSGHPALFAELEAMGRARMALRKGDKQIIGGIFDLGARSQRDELFRQAWASAVKAAASPDSCPRED